MSKRPLASGLPAKPITTPTQVSTKLPAPSSTRSAPPRPPRVNNNSHINQPGLAPPLPAGPPPPLLNANGNGPYGVGPQAFPGAIPPQQYQQQQQQPQQPGAMSYQQQQPGQVDPAAHAAAWAAYYAVGLLTSLATRRIMQYGMIRRAGCWMKTRSTKHAADSHRRKDSPTRTPPLRAPSLPTLPALVAPTLPTQTTATAWGPHTATTSTLNNSPKRLSHSSLHTAHQATSTPPRPVLHPRPTVRPELDPHLLSSTAVRVTSSSSSSSRGSITLSRNRNKDRPMAISALLRVSLRYRGMAAPRRRCPWRGHTRCSRVSRPCRSSLRPTSRTFRAISIISSRLRLRRHRWRGTKPGQADKDKGSDHQGRVHRARRRTGHTALDHLPGKGWACRAG